jgi:flagellar protein FlaG
MLLERLTAVAAPDVADAGARRRLRASAEPQATEAPPPAARDAAALERALTQANRALAEKGRELSFEFDRELGRVIAKLVDTTTREVIRQVPSEELLAIARALAAGEDAGVLLRGRG